MSDTPFMQFYPSDFLRDTLHLSANEIGVYMLLLMAMWSNGGTLPSDRKRLNRIARGAITDAVMAYFDDDDEGGITQKRLRKELDRAKKKAVARAEAGSAGGHAKALKDKKAGLANATAKACHSPEPDTRETTNVVSGAKAPTPAKRAHRLPEDWQPRKEDFDKLSSEGFSFSEIQDQVPRFRDYWRGNGRAMVDWFATFRNWVRKSAEIGQGRGGPRAQSPPKRNVFMDLGTEALNKFEERENAEQVTGYIEDRRTQERG
jgi:uncharacterized protein YdaU (DUF1376 family)